jgi:hypothetical protein
MKKIDPHGEALDLLHDERDLLEAGLTVLKPRIRKLNQLRQADNVAALEVSEHLFGGTMGELTKLSNDLRRRLNNVEATRKLLKEDRADQQQDAWDEEQYRLAAADAVPYLPCGCW